MNFITETSPFVCLRERTREREKKIFAANLNIVKNIYPFVEKICFGC